MTATIHVQIIIDEMLVLLSMPANPTNANTENLYKKQDLLTIKKTPPQKAFAQGVAAQAVFFPVGQRSPDVLSNDC